MSEERCWICRRNLEELEKDLGISRNIENLLDTYSNQFKEYFDVEVTPLGSEPLFLDDKICIICFHMIADIALGSFENHMKFIKENPEVD
jgi:hypothetical protein